MKMLVPRQIRVVKLERLVRGDKLTSATDTREEQNGTGRLARDSTAGACHVIDSLRQYKHTAISTSQAIASVWPYIDRPSLHAC